MKKKPLLYESVKQRDKESSQQRRRRTELVEKLLIAMLKIYYRLAFSFSSLLCCCLPSFSFLSSDRIRKGVAELDLRKKQSQPSQGGRLNVQYMWQHRDDTNVCTRVQCIARGRERGNGNLKGIKTRSTQAVRQVDELRSQAG